ncbi:MAG TPA: VCBS repeat-containing protein [Thermoanaerobaculia bacterium]|nr:VCBS repeat-containing protein [Thermoanaerobaculia bacterium]
MRKTSVMFALLFLFTAVSASAATRTWSGAVNALWSNAGNWEEGIVPASGDSIVFPPFSRSTSTNDLFSGTYASLFIDRDALNLGGNLVQLSNGVTVGSTATILFVSMPILMHGTQAMNCANADCAFDDLRWNGLITFSTANTVTRVAPPQIRLRGYGTFVHNSGHASYAAIEGMDGALLVNAGSVGYSKWGSTTGIDLHLNGDCDLLQCTARLTPGTARSLHANGGLLELTAVNVTQGHLFFGSRSIVQSTVYPYVGSSPILKSVASAAPGADGAVAIDNAVLRLMDLPAGRTPGSVVTIVDNDGADPVTGTFAGLAEGSNVMARRSRQRFQMSYTGGSGNDVTVTALAKRDVAHDLDNDGRSDIFWRHATTGENYRWSMNSHMVASTGPINTVADANWKIAALADFDGDGDNDVLWRHAVSGENYMYLMQDGSILSAGPVNRIEDLTWSIVATGDFNIDGKFDIVWQNSASGEVYIYLMNGTAVLRGGSVREVGPGWRVAGAGDFNFDTYADIVFQNEDTGEIWTWLMQNFTIITEGHTDLRPDATIAGVGQFGRDPSNPVTFDVDDLLLRNNETGAVEVYFMNGYAPSWTSTFAFVDPDWEIVAAGDYNGDSYNDVLWRHAITGENYMYLLQPTQDANGVGILSGHELPPIPDPNWKIVR